MTVSTSFYESGHDWSTCETDDDCTYITYGTYYEMKCCKGECVEEHDEKCIPK